MNQFEKKKLKENQINCPFNTDVLILNFISLQHKGSLYVGIEILYPSKNLE